MTKRFCDLCEKEIHNLQETYRVCVESNASIYAGKLAKLMCLDTLGYSAKDIEVITPDQYEAEFGVDEDG